MESRDLLELLLITPERSIPLDKMTVIQDRLDGIKTCGDLSLDSTLKSQGNSQIRVGNFTKGPSMSEFYICLNGLPHACRMYF